jgi:hypothetical protein
MFRLFVVNFIDKVCEKVHRMATGFTPVEADEGGTRNPLGHQFSGTVRIRALHPVPFFGRLRQS